MVDEENKIEEKKNTEESSQPEETSKVENELKECKDKYLRLLAEMENMRKRIQKEKQENARFATENVISEFLSPLDNFENALKFAEQMPGEIRNWALGFQMILNQFKEVLNTHGISAFTSEGMPFDPHKHEAVETEETETVPEGTILQEFVRGYKSGDRTIRPARVKVAKTPMEKIQENKK
jgi:molecular chaperone GrpE